MNKLYNTLETIYIQEEINILHEGFGDFIKTITVDKFKFENFIEKIKKVKDIESFKRVTNFVPKLNLKQINIIAKEKIDNFTEKKNITTKKLNKDIPEKHKDVLTTIIATIAKDDKHMDNMIKKVNNYNLNWETANENLIFNLYFSIGFAFGIGVIVPLILGIAPSVHVFGLYLAIFLVIDAIFYAFDLI